MMAGPGKGSPEVTKLEQALEELEGGPPWEGASPGALHPRKKLVLSQKVPVQGFRLDRANVPLTQPCSVSQASDYQTLTLSQVGPLGVCRYATPRPAFLVGKLPGEQQLSR